MMRCARVFAHIQSRPRKPAIALHTAHREVFMEKFIKAAVTILIIAACIQSRFAEAFPQDTRGEAIARQQAEKAAKPPGDDTTRAERIFLAVKKELIDTPSGFYPLLGSVYSGGGLALGGGYRHYVGDRTFLDVKALWSIRNY